jgi:HSP20 family protein
MSLIRRSDPARGAWPLRDEVNRLFDDFFGGAALTTSEGWPTFLPALDVSETAEAVIVKAEIPGIDPKNVHVQLVGNTLTLRGEKMADHEEKDRSYLRVERLHGAFSRTLTLPDELDPEKIKATAKNGVLTIEVAKAERARPRQIEVKVTD